MATKFSIGEKVIVKMKNSDVLSRGVINAITDNAFIVFNDLLGVEIELKEKDILKNI